MNGKRMIGMQDIITKFLTDKGCGRTDLKAVLFDMDGVLFDSMKNHTLAWCKAITALGILCKRDEFYQYEGATGEWTINLIFNRAYARNATPKEIEHIYAAKSRYFNELPESPVMPGAGEILEEVKRAGLTPVLVTGSGQRSLLEPLEREYPGTFTADTMVTAFDVKCGKPNPEPYLRGLEKAGVKPFEAMVIENAPLGVRAGVAAGIFTIAVNTGPIPEKQLADAGANLIYPNMPVLLPALRFFLGNVPDH